MVRTRARWAAAEWHSDREAATEIEARLDRGGFDAIDINAEVFVQARELFEMFDQLIQLAQNHRTGVLDCFGRLASAENLLRGSGASSERRIVFDNRMSDKNLAVDKVLFAGALGEYQQRLEVASGFRVRWRVGLTSASMNCSHAEVLYLERSSSVWTNQGGKSCFHQVCHCEFNG
jgi:hypothetical protein